MALLECHGGNVLCCEPMPWYSKEQAISSAMNLFPGTVHLHGDTLAKRYNQDWLREKQYPLIQFPSGIQRELVENDETPKLHIWSALELPLFGTRDAAYEIAQKELAEQGYQVLKQFDNNLTIMNVDGNRAYQIIYDNQKQQVIDIHHYPKWAMELLDGESRAVLPALYTTEKLGSDAIAPIKFFTPDSNWTWYPTEFDGTDIFFGLVSGFEVELGYFSLSELESARGQLGLPIERDLDFHPTSLKVLRLYHEQ